MSHITLVIFDFNGVITTGSYWNISRCLATKYKRPAEEIYNALYKYHNLAALKKLPESEIFKRGLRDLGFFDNPRIIESEHAQITSILNKSILKYTSRLRKQGYCVIGLSKNVPKMFTRNLKISGAAQYFDALINTYDLNLPKASKKTIQYLMHEFKIKKASEIILVDDQEINLVEAKHMGVHTVFYQNFKDTYQKMQKILRTKEEPPNTKR